ncbi:hypothetical protein D7V94_11200 [Parablautia intestinalis]|uniref:Conjugal transfer protein n=1 Tax=Parablautia intestinalis TaxID=2320100 RepID=A0A3A9AJ60_9FIRM|nr:hypothetical protein D7V94_11200 [Parablautia intestinalis]
MQDAEWIRCPVCGNKTRGRIREDTVLKNYPLYCPKCKSKGDEGHGEKSKILHSGI